jgi:hypothetical protein
MKKLLTLLVIAGSITAAQAQNWTYTGSATNGMQEYTRFPSTTSYNNGRVETVWKKAISIDGTSSMSRVEFHCPSQMFRVIQYSRYYPNGSVIPNVGWSYNESMHWELASPESMAEATLYRVCVIYGPK